MPCFRHGTATAAAARLQHGRSGHHVGGRLDLSAASGACGASQPYTLAYHSFQDLLKPAGGTAVFPVHTAPAVRNLVRTRRDSPKIWGRFRARGIRRQKAEERAMSTAVAINFNQAILLRWLCCSWPGESAMSRLLVFCC